MDKKVGVNQPKRIENAKILIANTSMDADKIKVIFAFHTACFTLLFFHRIAFHLKLVSLKIPIFRFFQIFGSKVRVESVAKVADLELAEKVLHYLLLICHS